jgi:hypothetical protein
MKLAALAALAPVTSAAQTISSSILYPDDAKAVFSDFLSGQYAQTVDQILSYKFGNRECLYSEEAVEDEEYKPAVQAYLYSRWRYIAQAMAYLESEYNPIENYAGDETETTTFDSAVKKRTITDDMDQRETQDDIPQHKTTQHFDTFEEFFDPKVSVDTQTTDKQTNTVISDKQTSTTKNAPFESSTFYNKDQTTIEGQQTGGGLKTETTISGEQAGGALKVETKKELQDHAGAASPDPRQKTERPMREDYEKTDPYTDKHKQLSYKDVHTIDDAAFQDVTTRTLIKSGNIGVQTAAQMLAMDADFWDHFRWLDELAHELAVILGYTVWAM